MKKFTYRHKIQYYETDQMKIVHHSNYIRWFEECRVAWLESINEPFQLLEEKGIFIPVIDITCQYKKMTRFGEDVDVLLQITEFNGSKIEFSYQIQNAVHGVLCVIGTSSHCFLSKEYQLINLKKKFPDLYEKIVNQKIG